MEAEILTRRAEITRAIDGQTICGLLEQAARQFADRPALSEPAAAPGPDAPDGPAGSAALGGAPGRWQTLTWPQAREQALRLAASFGALGLAPGERVALMMANRTEHWLADQAAVHAGGVPVTEICAVKAPSFRAGMKRHAG